MGLRLIVKFAQGRRSPSHIVQPTRELEGSTLQKSKRSGEKKQNSGNWTMQRKKKGVEKKDYWKTSKELSTFKTLWKL